MQTRHYANPLYSLEGHKNTIFTVAFDPSGKQVASGSFDNIIHIWDLKSKRPIAKFTGHGINSPHNDKGILSLAYSPSGTLLASGAFDNTIKIWSTTQSLWRKVMGSCLVTLDTVDHYKFCYTKSVAFSPNGSTLAAHKIGHICLFDVHTFKEHGRIWCENMRGAFGALVYAPSANQMASGGKNCICIYDTRSNKLCSQLEESNYVMGVSYLKTETALASGSDDGNLAIWDLRTTKKTSEVKAHSQPITSLSYSSQNDRIVSGSKDKQIKLWDTCLKCHSAVEALSDIYCVAFSPSGAHFASGGTDIKVKLWDISTLGNSLSTYCTPTMSAAAAATDVHPTPTATSSSANSSSKLTPQKPVVFESKQPTSEIKNLFTQGKMTEAFQLCTQHAEAGDADAQFMLAVMYEEGVGTEIDENKALEWHYAASTQNHPKADYHRAKLLFSQCLTEEKILNIESYVAGLRCLSRAMHLGSPDVIAEAVQLRLMAVSLLKNVDWSSATSTDLLTELMSELNIQDESDKNFIDQMRTKIATSPPFSSTSG